MFVPCTLIVVHLRNTWDVSGRHVGFSHSGCSTGCSLSAYERELAAVVVCGVVALFIVLPPLYSAHTGLLLRHTGVSFSLGSLPTSSSLVSVAQQASSVTNTVTVSLPVMSIPFTPQFSMAVTTSGGQGQPSQLGQVMGGPLHGTNVLGMILSPALQPIPARLVRRILSGDFVEMRDLLIDNITLHDQLEAVQGPLNLTPIPGALRPRLREVPSLISWVFCFLAYIAVRTSDHAARDMLAYCRLIIREGLRHGGNGWRDYDRCFRSQAAIDRSQRWNVLLSDFHAATIISQRTSGGVCCSLCRGFDHTSSQCALSFVQQPLIHCPSASIAVTSTDNRVQQPRSRTPRPICNSWNSGGCIFPGTCTFRHVCATCGLRHRARDCPDTPADSSFKRRSDAAGPSSTPSSVGQKR